MPQRRNQTARSSYGGRTVALRWPWGGIRFLPCLGCLENRTAASWRPCGALTAAVRQTCNSCKNSEVAVRSPPGLLAVTLRFLISWIVWSSCGRPNICDHNYRRPQDLMIFKNQVLQTVDRRTVRWPYGGSMICDRGIRHWYLDGMGIKIQLFSYNNKANLRDLSAATSLVILLKLDSNHRFFSPCDLEIWWMSSKTNRAILYYIKLCT